MMFDPQSLLDSAAYPHPVSEVRLVETHMSWVYLTGELAYKVKKPVLFPFADFSTLALREHFCHRELELNQRFAPDIYVDVVPLYQTQNGWRVGEDPTSADEWAVRMRQFPDSALCDVALSQGRLSTQHLFRFGQRLAAQHATLPVVTAEPIATAIEENFTTLTGLELQVDLGVDLPQLRARAEQQVTRYSERLLQRSASRYARRCHGDLHLKNLVLLDDQIQAFDCLEFNEALSSIDVWADVAFLFMDLSERSREDLAYAFIDGYLDVSGDYAGVVLLPLFAGYRAMVRAKVAGLSYAQHADEATLQTLRDYLKWTDSQCARPPGRVLLTHGFSGSGKSYWSAQLVSTLGAVRVRSDIYRKVRAGYGPLERTARHLSGGVYSAESSASLYAQMAELALLLAGEGETVIIDAANLRYEQRAGFYDACEQAGVTCLLLSFEAPDQVLRQRLQARQDDASEADETVLDWQIANADPLRDSEPVVLFETETEQLSDLLTRLGE